MRAKRYNKRIEIWQVTKTPDGYGGETVTDELITKSWCSIKTASTNKSNSTRAESLGITDPTNTIFISTRLRNDITYNAINQYIVYNGFKYIIQNEPTSVDFTNTEVEIIATRERTKSVENIDVIE